METVIPESERSVDSQRSAPLAGLENPASNSAVIALLGRADQPTDAIQDYCTLLGEALARKGYRLSIERLPWFEAGWPTALSALWRSSRQWKGKRVLVQYTSLMWSRRGFPLMFLVVLLILKLRGARTCVVFHDVLPFPGNRAVDRIRQTCQRYVFRKASQWATASVLTVPVEETTWLPRTKPMVSFIPVGSNIPFAAAPVRPDADVKTIAVFGITGGGTVGNEVADIAFVAQHASQFFPGIRLLTFGRGSLDAQPRFERTLEDSKVDYRALGIVPASDASELLSQADVALFVRGGISTQRGSALASIACGIPLVAYAGPDLPNPFTKAGVVPVACGDRERLAAAVIRVLADRQLRLELRQKNQQAYKEYFSWDAIAARFAELLNHV